MPKEKLLWMETMVLVLFGLTAVFAVLISIQPTRMAQIAGGTCLSGLVVMALARIVLADS
jgi:hypothetical protein